MTVTGKVVLGVVGLGLLATGVYLVSERIAKAREIPGRTPAPLPRPTRDYVGSGWSGWPHKDVFPDIDAFVQALRRLGYHVDDDLLTGKSMGEVERFQTDYNMWSRLWGTEALGEIENYADEGQVSPGGTIAVDGLVGRGTTEAIYNALDADATWPGGFPALVLEFRANSGG